jgi:hypothetical protein
MDERTWGPLLGVVVVVAVVAPIAWVAIKGRNWLIARAQKQLHEILVRVGAVQEQREGYVPIRFPTYVGAVVTVQEITTSAWVPRGSARVAINAMSGLSFKYGLITIFAPYVLFMVFVNYVIHLPRLASS